MNEQGADPEGVVFARLGEILAAVRRHPAGGWSPCHCLCQYVHPAAPGVCQAKAAVTSRRLVTGLLGVTEVPLCWPCASVQGVTGGAYHARSNLAGPS